MYYIKIFICLCFSLGFLNGCVGAQPAEDFGLASPCVNFVGGELDDQAFLDMEE